MDNSNQAPVTNAEQPVQPPVAQGNPAAAIGATNGGKNNKMLWIIGIVVAIIIVLGVAAYMLMGRQGGSATNQQAGINVNDLQTEADSIKDEDLDSDFKALDSDLQNL